MQAAAIRSLQGKCSAQGGPLPPPSHPKKAQSYIISSLSHKCRLTLGVLERVLERITVVLVTHERPNLLYASHKRRQYPDLQSSLQRMI